MTSFSTGKKIPIILIGLGPPIAIIAYSFAFCRQNFFFNYVVAFFCIVICVFALSSLFQNRFCRILRNTIMILGITYILLELTTYILLSLGLIRLDLHFFFHGFEGVNKNGAVYDTVSGYRAAPGHMRYISINNGKLEMDHTVNVNNQGWFADKDYTYKKSKKTKKRYMVLGDSFSSGLIVPKTWPDIVQKLLSQAGNDSIELYNFSLDGIGIQNWYRIFMFEIVPKYEFDGIIIATSAEPDGVPDLDRKFFMAHASDQTIWIQNLDALSHIPPDVFPVKSAAPMARISSDSELDKIEKTYTATGSKLRYTFQKPNLWFLKAFFEITDGFIKINKFFEYSQPYQDYNRQSDMTYKMESFDKRYKYGFLLKNILSYCRENKKEVILVNIPDFKNSLDHVHGINNINQTEHRFLYRHYNLKHYDGFEIFSGKNDDFVRQCFYEYDMHWNKIGVELFSHKFFESGIL